MLNVNFLVVILTFFLLLFSFTKIFISRDICINVLWILYSFKLFYINTFYIILIYKILYINTFYITSWCVSLYLLPWQLEINCAIESQDRRHVLYFLYIPGNFLVVLQVGLGNSQVAPFTHDTHTFCTHFEILGPIPRSVLAIWSGGQFVVMLGPRLAC